uniref:Uncharacterized protein n=1 Tax=Anopheles culicifacies TaxID=139723 RepID=A0A182MK63_9DIPT
MDVICWMLTVAIVITVHQSTAAAASATSVCSYLCTCTNQNFATVDCAFARTTPNWTEHGASSFVLDGKLQLPASATALNIKLIAGGQLEIRKDFFKQNNINHLSIDGGESRTGSSDTSVQFHEGALCNNNGQFPEILITNIGRLVMHRNISCRAHLLNITHVKDVLLKTEFLSVDEAEVFIQDVSNLQIEPNAFGGSTSSKIQIYRTTIESLPKLGVSFRLLSFNECNISEIVTHAFDANEVEHVEFVHCRLTSLRQKAVTERLLSDSFIFRRCYIHRIEKQFVDGSGLKNLLLESNTINEIAADAFTFTSIFTVVTGNHVIRTGRDWLQPKDWQNVTIAGNSFGEFNGILLRDRKRDGAGRTKAHCYFGNNTITNALPDSFTFGHSCHINAIHFGRECDCTYDNWLKELVGPGVGTHRETLLSTIASSASCQVEDSLRYCFSRNEAPANGTSTVGIGQVNVQYFLLEFCQKEGSKKCSSYTSGEEGNRKPPPLIPFEKIGSLDDDDEDGFMRNNILWISITLVAMTVILLLLLTVCFCRRRVAQTHQTMTTLPCSRSNTIRTTSLNRSSFTPADRRIIAGALSWIKDTYDQKIWSEINTPMQQLLAPSQQSGGIEEQVKVRLIGTILDSLKRHEINPTQIVALNDILYRQLGPPPPELVEHVRPTSASNDELGHIYDELQLNRAPMYEGTGAHNVGLLGDYAAPLDHGGMTVVPEGIYSEPVLHDQLLLQRNGDNRNLISPYAIGDATVPRNPPGTEGNLPDVILLRRPSGNVPWKANSEEDNDDEDEDEIDGEAERKTMLRPADGVDGSAGPTYAISMKQLKRPHRGNTPPPQSSSALPPTPPSDGGEDLPDGTDGNRSEHSGSSMQTVRIEDMTLADDSSEQQRQQFEREQEQLEEIVHQPLRCERIDNSQWSQAAGNDWGSFHGRIGERVLRCDCHDTIRTRRDSVYNPTPRQSPAFMLPPFEATTVATDILIVNCRQLLVPAGTFRAIRSGFLPRTIRFVNIEQLTLESFAFESGSQTTGQQVVNRHDPHPVYGPITLSIERCQLDELPANVFHGAALRSVLFSASQIGVVRPLAVSTRFQQFIFSDTVIGHFARHAFKRALMEQLHLHNVTMTGAWPSQAWLGLIVSNAIQIRDSIFLQTINPAAVTESSSEELLLQGNAFNESLADEAFQLEIKTRIRLIDNTFGLLSSNLFRGIRISNDSAWNAQPNILLERNRIDTFTVSNDAHTFLIFPRNFSVNLEGFRIAQLATCESTNISFPAWPEIYFLQPFATTSRDDPESYISVEQFRAREGCDSDGPDMVLVIVLSTLLGVTVLGAVIGGLLCWRHYRKRQRMLILEQKMVQPVPRTYRETQILLKLETVGTLKTDF